MTRNGIPIESWEGRARDDLRARWGVPRLLIFGVATSTNDIARDLAAAGAPPGTVVLADHQTAGRGRGGRTWLAPPGAALLLSIILRPPQPPSGEAAPGVLPLLIGLAVSRAIGRVARVRARIKWPNDVVLPGAGKVAGILCEAAMGGPHGGHVVAGIGINVGQTAADFPPEIRTRATSLLVAAGRRVSRPTLAGRVIAEVLRLAAHGAKPLDARLLADLRRRDVLRGHAVSVDGRRRGTVQGIAADGALLLRGGDGAPAIPVRSGIVRLVEDRTPTRGSARP